MVTPRMTSGRKLAIVWLLLLGALQVPLGDVLSAIAIFALLMCAGYVSPLSRARTAVTMTTAAVATAIADVIVDRGARLTWQESSVWESIGWAVVLYALLWLSAMVFVSLGSKLAHRRRSRHT